MKNNAPEEVSQEALTEAIRNLHDCKATWVGSVPVKETFEGEFVWEGVVQIFDVTGHPSATRCYAWSYVIDEKTQKRKFFAVLHQGYVDSPLNAIRSAIVADSR
jgi:hypothetical protein